jgi:hypothetical protein
LGHSEWRTDSERKSEMVNTIIVILAILFLVALAMGAFIIVWNKDKSSEDNAKKKN